MDVIMIQQENFFFFLSIVCQKKRFDIHRKKFVKIELGVVGGREDIGSVNVKKNSENCDIM